MRARPFALLAVASTLAACDDSGGEVTFFDASVDAPVVVDAARDATPIGRLDAPVEPSDANQAPVDAGVDAADASDAGAPLALIDAGAGCVPPTGETRLAPQAAGLPATGLVLWLRGDRGVYKTATNEVCAWADQSDRGAVFWAKENQPTWLANGVANRDGIRFAGNRALRRDDVLGLAAQSARTFVAVQKLNNLTGRFNAVHQGAFDTPGTYISIDTNPFNTVGGREGVYMQNNAYDSDLTTSTDPRLHVYSTATMTIGAPVLPSLTYRVNGAARTLTRTPGGLGNGNFENFSAANRTEIGAGTGDAVLAEVLVYDHVLNPSELAALEAALKSRYGGLLAE